MQFGTRKVQIPDLKLALCITLTVSQILSREEKLMLPVTPITHVQVMIKVLTYLR